MSLIQGRRSGWWVVFLALLLFLPFPASALRGGKESVHFAGGNYRTSTREIPGYAREVFAYVLRNGRPPRGYVGDRVWQNREHRLPAGGDYREYDVHPKIRGVNRGPERIIVDRTAGKGWYTGDHYRTFIPIGAK
jgi:guanyl-specific ribonuclease Sa